MEIFTILNLFNFINLQYDLTHTYIVKLEYKFLTFNEVYKIKMTR